MTTNQKKFQIQDNQYGFPYHYIPDIDQNGQVTYSRSLSWGFRYLCYLKHIKETIENLKPDSVLDVGCGDGKLLGVLDSKIKKVGTDISQRPILFAKAFHPEIEFYAKDAQEINEEFDIVIAMEVMEHIPDSEMTKFIKTLEDRVKNNGHVIISVPTTVLPLNKKHYRHYDKKIFKEQIEKTGTALRIVKIDHLYRSTVLTRWYFKIINTKWWLVDIKPLNQWLWNYIWKNLRKTTPKYGESIVVTLKKEVF